MNIAIIFAGGKGERMGAGRPKQFLPLGGDGSSILACTIRCFNDNPNIDKIYVAIIEGYEDMVKGIKVAYKCDKIKKIFVGGETALDSQYKALEIVTSPEENNPPDSIVLMHDGVRPFITDEIIDSVIQGVKENGNAITAAPAIETVFTSCDGKTIDNIPPRQNCYSAKAPQGYNLGELFENFKRTKARPEGYGNCTDSCSLMRECGVPINFVIDSSGYNIKITTRAQYMMARALKSMLEEMKQTIKTITSEFNPFHGGSKGADR